MKSLSNIKYFASLLILFIGFLTASQATAQQTEPGYRLNPGDRLQISVWREENLSRQLVILPDGTIGFPLIGVVKLSGLTVAEAEGLLNEKLGETIRNPNATVVVNSVEGNRAYILGRIVRPGGYVLQSDMTVPQIISLAGGFTEFAKESKIAVIRRVNGRVERIGIDLDQLLKGELDEKVANLSLRAGDVVVVP